MGCEHLDIFFCVRCNRVMCGLCRQEYNGGIWHDMNPICVVYPDMVECEKCWPEKGDV